VRVRARPFSVPRVEGEGETSFSASWTAARYFSLGVQVLNITKGRIGNNILNAIATPLPPICNTGAVTQNAVSHPLPSPLSAFRKNQLHNGAAQKKIGHAM
jgi:hypothetical protein